jgi:hypothetical protein
MKKIIVGISLLVAVLVPGLSSAAINVSDSALPFGVNVKSLDKVLSTGETRIDLEVTNVADRQNIGSWKLRLWCDEGIALRFGTDKQNLCNQAVDIADPALSKFYISLMNPEGKTVGFSLKLKAYDRMGQWIHSEQESFLWK